MKFRHDFVTNSSSSSYVIALRKVPDDGTELSQGLNQLLRALVYTKGDHDTYVRQTATSKDELKWLFADRYGEESFETLMDDKNGWYNTEEIWATFDECMSVIDDGGEIVYKYVGYGDEAIHDILGSIKGMNTYVKIIEGGDY